MDRRRGRKQAIGNNGGTALVAELPRPATATDPSTNAKLDAVLSELHELRRLVHRIAVPLETVTLTEAARRLCRSTKTVKRLHARRLFSDGRPPELRVAGADLVFFADEIDAYRLEGEMGVKRVRESLGRN